MRPFVQGFRVARATNGAVAFFCFVFVGLIIWSALDSRSSTDLVRHRWFEAAFSVVPAAVGIFAVRRFLFWHRKVQAAARQSQDIPRI
jgi:hypothetical protein